MFPERHLKHKRPKRSVTQPKMQAIVEPTDANSELLSHDRRAFGDNTYSNTSDTVILNMVASVADGMHITASHEPYMETYTENSFRSRKIQQLVDFDLPQVTLLIVG